MKWDALLVSCEYEPRHMSWFVFAIRCRDPSTMMRKGKTRGRRDETTKRRTETRKQTATGRRSRAGMTRSDRA